MNLQTLIDRAEITDVLMRYFRGIDRRDWALVRGTFHDKAITNYAVTFRGHVEEFLDYLKSPRSLGGYSRTMHFAGNVVIDLDGDVAHTETYCIAHHTADPSHQDQVRWAGEFVVVWLRYIDRFERRDGEWRIAERNLVYEWTRDDSGGGWGEIAPEYHGAHGADDPVYQRGTHGGGGRQTV